MGYTRTQILDGFRFFKWKRWYFHKSSKFQEDVLDTQELSYSADLSDLFESDQSETNESITDLCLLKPYDFEPLVKKIPNNKDFETTEATTKHW